MNYKSVKQFRVIPNILLPSKTDDNKNIVFGIFSENESFLDLYPFLPITPKAKMRHVFVPIIQRPILSRLTTSYRSEIKSHGLFPVTGRLGQFKSVSNKNFFLDSTRFLSLMQQRYKIKKFNTGRFLGFANQTINQLSSVPKEDYERVLVYSVSLDEFIPKSYRYRKIYPVLAMLQAFDKGTIKELPFDKLFLHFYHSDMDNGKIILLYDKNQKLNLGRILSLIKKIKHRDTMENLEKELENNVEEAVDTINYVPDTMKNTLKKVVSDNVSSGTISISDEDEKEGSEIVKQSVVKSIMGDDPRADEIIEKTKNNKKENEIIINQYSKYLLPKEKVKSESTNVVVKDAKPEVLNDNQNPKHILEKRQIDFGENLKSDIENAFKVLEKKDNPLKVLSVDVKTISSPASELNPSIKDRFFVELSDVRGKKHNVSIELPHLTKNGTLMVNGQQKVVVNQIVTYPIFFFKPYHGKFTSSYSSLTIHSKRLKNSSYLMLFMGNYKFPMILYMSYKLGFDYILKQYGVEMTTVEEKDKDTITLPDKSIVKFNSKTQVGRELVEGLKYSIHAFDENNFDLRDQKTWKLALEKFIGSRNCIYMLDQQWNNIVTPVEIEILSAKGDPIEVESIIKYIATEVVKGRVDDRNSADKQRIRTSEIFVALLQKQIYSAYNEYESKYLSGDPDAEFFINPTKTFSDVLVSQNVQTLENINPIEEISSLTRITPVGIGGVPDMMAFPPSAMDVHDSYYGTIDPLETPDGAGVGVQQNLSIGSPVSTVRGMINVKRRDQVKSSEILSVGPALIPFVNSNDGCRVLMAAGQMKQAVPLENPEVPAIQTGFESIYTPMLSDSFIKKSPFNGTVESIDKDLITIKDNETGRIEAIDLKPITLKSGQGMNGLSIFKPSVSVGQRVKKDQILSEGSHIKDGTVSTGLNLLCTVMPWKGFNFEDGMVVSESAAKKFVSLHISKEKTYLSNDEDVSFMVNVGDKVVKGEKLISYSPYIDDVESFKHLRTTGGEVVSIEVYSNLPDDQEIPEKLKPHYEETKKRMIKLHGSYPEGYFKEKGKKFEGILVEFMLKSALRLYKGDKINNRHFNKGVIGLIEKDSNMPVTPWGERIDLIYRPLSFLGRMNTGQLCEMHTGLISKELAKYAVENDREKFIKMFEKVLNLLDGTEMHQYTKNVMKKLKSMSPKDYKDMVIKFKEDKFVPLIFPPFKTPPRENIVKALRVIGLEPSYKLKLPEFGIVTDTKMPVGYMYVNKLEHMSEKKIHARGTGSYISKTLAPTAGKRREGGQKVGEGDLYGLLAWDSPILIEEFFGPSSSDHLVKNEMISNIVQNGQTEHIQSKTNPVKDMFGSMMMAIHLESE